jgi:hypothetical protein
VLGVRFRNELFFGVALQAPAYFVENVVGIAEISVTTDLENPFGDEATTAVEWLLGGRGRLRDVEITLAGGTGLTGGVGTSTFRVIGGVSFAPRVHDRDRDRIVDEADACPTLPEDDDDHSDEDGCPEPDNDGDLVPDLDDRCPDDPAESGRDLDDDGCTDPDLDRDDDGIDDARDRCPDAGEDRDGHQDEDGCPDLDDDGDGVPDTEDACRSEVEDRDGHRDDDGCPDPDDDRDGVRDADDRCADEAETINGRDDGDGCPDRGGRSLWRRTGQPGGPDFVLEGTVRFARDGTILAASRSAVDQLARHLIAAWGTRLRIAIGRGTDLQISSLRTALVERGVSAEAIELFADPSTRGVRVSVIPPAPTGDRTTPEEGTRPAGANEGQ